MASVILAQMILALAIGLLIILTQAGSARQTAKVRLPGTRHGKARNGLR
jgi:hypothetical protein